MTKNKKVAVVASEDSGEGLEGRAVLPYGFEVVDVQITDSPYHKNLKGKVVPMGKAVAEKMEERGWGTIVSMFLILLMSMFVVPGNAQSAAAIRDFKSVYNLNSDTVTNTATVYLTSPVVSYYGQSTTIQVVVTKISGTVGGTISLQGSLDGTNFKALNTEETQTALATITATDGSTSYHWRLKGSPFTYYRVSWTGTGTMSASFSAKIMKH